MNLGLGGKHALVVGGGRGLGHGVALALAAEGAAVTILSRDRSALDKAAAEISQQTGVAVSTIVADLSDREGLLNAVGEAAAGAKGIDILVNNSGGPPPSGAAGIDAAVWRAQFEMMVVSVIALTDAVLPGMRKRGWGRILTIASSGVVEPNPLIGLSNALRSTLVGWSKTLATEVAPDGVTVNLLLPGWIETDRLREIDRASSHALGSAVETAAQSNIARIPVGRYGSVEEFGAVAAFLASEQASYVTGSMIRIDGGAIRSV